MKKYFCAESALDRLDIPGFRGFIVPKDKVIRPEYVVFTTENFYRPQKSVIHSCKIKGADTYTRGDSCSPALAFLQVALNYDFRKLVFLAQLLCSWRKEKDPICTKQELWDCANSLEGFYGRRKACRALRYVRDGCRSPMEAYVYISLCLPMCHGGCGLRTFVFNHEIVCKRSGKRYYADLCDVKRKVILEYDSYEYHNNVKSFSQDTARVAELQAEGYTVIPIRYQQLLDKNSFEL